MRTIELSAALVLVGLLQSASVWAQRTPVPLDPPRPEHSVLSLRDALAEALRSSPELRAPEAAVQLAAIDARRAASQYAVKVVPNVGSGTDTFGFTRNSVGVGVSKRLASGADVSVATDWYQYGTQAGAARDAGYSLSVVQPLLRGFGATAAAELTKARRVSSGSTRSLTVARQSLVVTVTQAYLEVLRQTSLRDGGERALERAARLRTMSEARARIGLATQLDVLRAELLASQSESAASLARESVETAKDRLAALLGRPFESPMDVPADALEQVDRVYGFADDEVRTIDDQVSRALASRLDLHEARDRVDDARRSAAIAKWNLLPPVAATVTYTRRGLGGSFLEPYQQFWNGWRLGIATSYSLDRAAESAAVAQADVAVGAATQSANEAARHVASEVRQAHRAALRATGTIAIQEQAVRLAEKQVRLAELRFERGLDGNFDVIDAGNNLLQAQAALVGARVDRAMSLLALRRSTGGLDPDEILR